LGVARGNLSRRAGAVGAAVGRGWVVARAGAGHGTTATSSGAAAPAAVARPATIDGIWRTALAIARVASTARARETTCSVRARSVGIAIVGATAALVHVSTALAVARVASIARARETTCSVRAQRVRVAVVERAVVALVDVLACFTRAFVAGIALAREAAGCI